MNGTKIRDEEQGLNVSVGWKEAMRLDEVLGIGGVVLLDELLDRVVIGVECELGLRIGDQSWSLVWYGSRFWRDFNA